MELGKGLELKACEEQLRVLECLVLRKEGSGETLLFYSYLKGCCGKVEISLFSETVCNRTRENGLKLHCGGFRLDIRKNFFTEGVVKHWNRLPRKVVESPSLEVFKKLVNVALCDMV